MTIQRTQTNQQGFVAIFSVLIIMGILTLLAIGFAGITRQAQTRVLNHHLNSQAFYAAESGVNMASKALASGEENIAKKDECRNGGSFDYQINQPSNIAVSCLLINANPPNLEFTNVPVVGTSDPVVSFLSTLDTSRVNRVRFDWDAELDTDRIRNRSSAEFPPSSTWGSDVGIMRVDLVPSGTANRTSATNGSYTFYLYPSTNGSKTFNTSAGLINGQGATMVTRCDSTNGYRCSAVVTLNGSVVSGYYVRLQAYYNPVRARAAVLNSLNKEAKLKDGQAIIDSTGQANDVYRRIQVRVPVKPDAGFNTGMHNVFAIFGGDSICKRYYGIPGGTTTDPACSF